MRILHLKIINVALAMLSKLKKMRLFQMIFKHCICSFPSGSRGIPFLQIPQVERDEKVVGSIEIEIEAPQLFGGKKSWHLF